MSHATQYLTNEVGNMRYTGMGDHIKKPSDPHQYAQLKAKEDLPLNDALSVDDELRALFPAEWMSKALYGTRYVTPDTSCPYRVLVWRAEDYRQGYVVQCVNYDDSMDNTEQETVTIRELRNAREWLGLRVRA